jgi:hypothetical protein
VRFSGWKLVSGMSPTTRRVNKLAAPVWPSFKNLNNNSTSPLVYLGNLLTGSSHGGQVLAFAPALSVIAATGVRIVLGARSAYGIASYRALPGRLADVSPRLRTPAVATVVGQPHPAWCSAGFTCSRRRFRTPSPMCLPTPESSTASSTASRRSALVYYRRRVLSNWRGMLTIGLLPVAAVGFLRRHRGQVDLVGAGGSELFTERPRARLLNSCS